MLRPVAFLAAALMPAHSPAASDGLFEEFFASGARSFGIRDTRGNLVFGSGTTTVCQLEPDL